MHVIPIVIVIAAAGVAADAASTEARQAGTGYSVSTVDGSGGRRRFTDSNWSMNSIDGRKMAVRGPLTVALTTTTMQPLRRGKSTTTTESSFFDYFLRRDDDDDDDGEDDGDDDDDDDDNDNDDEDDDDDDEDEDYKSEYTDKSRPPKLRGVRRRHKAHKIVFPLLMAYKLKFFTMLPLLVGSLVLLVGTTGVAGFFFALFSAALGLQVKTQH